MIVTLLRTIFCFVFGSSLYQPIGQLLYLTFPCCPDDFAFCTYCTDWLQLVGKL